MFGGPRRRTEKISAIDRLEFGDWLWLKVTGEVKSSCHEGARKWVTVSMASEGVLDELRCAGNGDSGPLIEIESMVERSSEGDDSVEDSLRANMLDQRNRCVPVLANGAPEADSTVDTDGFLASASVAIEVCLLGSGINPWQASVGMGGKVLPSRSCRLETWGPLTDF